GQGSSVGRGGSSALMMKVGTGASTPPCSTSKPQAGHQIAQPFMPLVSTPRQILLVELQKRSSGWNSRCGPPLRVMCVRVIGKLARPYHCAASTCFAQSMSSTTNLMPVRTLTSASGHFDHHSLIRSALVVASLKPGPSFTSGTLSPVQGKTGTPRPASFSAASRIKDMARVPQNGTASLRSSLPLFFGCAVLAFFGLNDNERYFLPELVSWTHPLTQYSPGGPSIRAVPL